MHELYNQLKKLTLLENSAFYSSFQSPRPGEAYEIFSYHFVDKDSWQMPGAFESRGIMYRIDPESLRPIKLVSRTMHKFFNEEESVVNYSHPKYVMTKADGSLISSYYDGFMDLKLKSKTSINSDYANLAMELLEADSTGLKSFIESAEADGYTVNMELVAPDPKYRIVLYYKEPKLIILNCRHRETGEYMDFDKIPSEHFVGTVDISKLANLNNETNIEGYVVIDEDNNWYKKKCEWYLTRHRAKDFINTPNAFITLVLKDEADDVFALLADQPDILSEMQDLQHKVIEKANRIINTVSEYWLYNYSLSRKEYAIKGKTELDSLEFLLAMQYYTKSHEPNWNQYLLNWLKKIDWEN